MKLSLFQGTAFTDISAGSLSECSEFVLVAETVTPEIAVITEVLLFS